MMEPRPNRLDSLYQRAADRELDVAAQHAAQAVRKAGREAFRRFTTRLLDHLYEAERPLSAPADQGLGKGEGKRTF
jgi:hypothetical protein